MTLDTKLIFRAMKPKIAAKALQTFDRATAVVVGVSWAAAILMMVFAIYVSSLAMSAKHASENAQATEPNLPKIIHGKINQREIQMMVEGMQHRFPDIKFNMQGSEGLIVSTNDGNQFRQWLTALSYIDTIKPQYHWSMQQFCVGKCANNELMRAILVGETISFEMPTPPS